MKKINKCCEVSSPAKRTNTYLALMKFATTKRIIGCFLGLTSILSACENSQGEGATVFNNDNCLPVVKSVVEGLNQSKINLFVETSGSMSGFMSANGTSFQNDIWSIVEGLQNKVGEHLGLFQVRSKSEAITVISVADFKQKLNTGGFQSAKSTDIPEMLDSIFSKADDKTVSILVSDLIFSPENGNQAQHSQISTDIRQRFSVKGRSSELIQLYSDFYSKTRVAASPYYIWIIGEPKLVKAVSALVGKMITVPVNSADFAISLPRPRYSIFPALSQVTNALPIACPVDGSYYVYREYSDEDASEVKFWLGMNLSEAPAYMSKPEYLTKYLNVSGGTVVQIKDVSALREKSDKEIAYKLGLTHMVQIRADQIGEESIVELNLQRHLPEWLDQINIDKEDGLRTQTYGLKKMIKGIEDAQDTKQLSVFTEPLKIYITKQ